ncbi:MAG TPA: sugar phosphate isomerase/epimerase family protein [Clostridiales bacterium]|nr:sugar phosphate isomerase/epimerase family protein [Clostridiales bacterium]
MSTSTSIYFSRFNSTCIPIIDSIKRCAAIGYKVMDIDFHSGIKYDTYELKSSNWENWIETVGRIANEYSIIFSQAHAPFYNVADPEFIHREYYDEMVRRSIIASGKLGIKWMAMHAGTALDENRFVEISKKRNMKYFDPYIDLAAKNNVGIAIENMQEYLEEWRTKPRRRYTAGIEELCDLVDSFKTNSVGIVWDFGHANITGYDQVKSLKYLGKRLKATHVHDNKGLFDDHTLPFLGTINWYPIMQTLKEIGYEGDFTYELARYTNNIPEELIDDAIRLSISIGNYLLTL